MTKVQTRKRFQLLFFLLIIEVLLLLLFFILNSSYSLPQESLAHRIPQPPKTLYPRMNSIWRQRNPKINFDKNPLVSTPLEEFISCVPPQFENSGGPRPDFVYLHPPLLAHTFEEKEPLGEFLENGDLVIHCKSEIIEGWGTPNFTRRREILPAYSYTQQWKKSEYRWNDLHYTGDSYVVKKIPGHIQRVFVRCNERASVIPRAKDFHPSMLKKVKLEKEKLQTTSKNASSIKSIKPHVLIILLDCISRYQFVRSMPLTRSFFAKNPSSLFNFTNTNTNGLNSPPNKRALFAGYSVEGREIIPYGRTLWEYYQKKGYVTMYGENACPEEWSLFLSDTSWNYLFPKDSLCFFKDPETVYIRSQKKKFDPDGAVVNSTKCNKQKTKSPKSFSGAYLCSGDRYIGSYVFDYYSDFRKKVPKEVPTFGTIGLYEAHGDVVFPYLTDRHVFKNLQKLEQEGIFDDTIVFLLSDHGMHYGRLGNTPRGKIEKSQFLMNFVIPPSILNEFPELELRLRDNEDRLVTFLDVYCTLKHLSIFPKKSVDLLGEDACVSLIERKVPNNRSCKTAKIHDNSCFCRYWAEYNLTDPENMLMAKEIVEFVMNEINQEIQETAPEVCERLEMNQILRLREKDGKKLIQFEVKSKRDILPVFEVKVSGSSAGTLKNLDSRQTTKFASYLEPCRLLLVNATKQFYHYCDCKNYTAGLL